MFDRDDRLVLCLSDEPGEFSFTRPIDEDADELTCPFASLQCFQTRAEPELLTLLTRASDLDDFLEVLQANGYRVILGRPRPGDFARL